MKTLAELTEGCREVSVCQWYNALPGDEQVEPDRDPDLMEECTDENGVVVQYIFDDYIRITGEIYRVAVRFYYLGGRSRYFVKELDLL